MKLSVPQPSAIDAALSARFSAALSRVWPGAQTGGELGIAVSGGPDSVALLLLAHAALPKQ